MKTQVLTQAPFEVVVLDLDGAIVAQRELLDRYNPAIVPLQHRHAELRNWTSLKTMNELRPLVSGHFRTSKPKLFLYGSGGFHHFPYLFTQFLDSREPVTMIGLDGHSDLHRGVPGYIWSGQWVARCLERATPTIRKVVSIGVDKDLDISLVKAPLGVLTHRMDLMANGRFEMYPNQTRQTTFYGRMRLANPSVLMQPVGLFKTRADWRPISSFGSEEAFAEHLVSRIPTEAIYLTLDKDGLREEDCYSNYYGSGKHGSLSLDSLFRILRVVMQHKTVVGIDICGDFSRPAPPPTWLKQQWTNFEMSGFPPKLFDRADLKQINEQTNLRLLAELLKPEHTPQASFTPAH